MQKSIYHTVRPISFFTALKRMDETLRSNGEARPSEVSVGQATRMMDIVTMIGASTGVLIDELIAATESNEAEVRYLIDILSREFDVKIRQSHLGVFTVTDWGLLNQAAVLRKHTEVVGRYIVRMRPGRPRK